jgi:drug/metabolite transporter (DMT)-like permease
MSLTAIVLLSLSAFLHASWNFLSKRFAASSAFFTVALLAVALCTSPALFYYRSALIKVSATFWLFVVATGFLEMIYVLGLSRAYKAGDMSLAYPLIRALPILLVAFMSVSLGRAEALSGVGILGMTFVTVGCLMLPLQTFAQWHPKIYASRVMLWIALSALGVAGYTVVDDVALRILRQYLGVTSGTVVYSCLQASSTVVFLVVYLLFNKSERVLKTRDIPVACGVGLLSALTYALVLAALAFVKDVSYANAFRQLSIPIGAVMGIVLAKEGAPPPKLWGLAVMVAGLILTTLG